MDTSSIIVIAAAAALAFFLLHTYNRLVRLRNKVRNAWSDIDVTLKRRHDLVPGLVEAVRGYMVHERETFENVTRARAEAASSGGSNVAVRAAAELALAGAIRNVFVKVENYPALRAAENMQLLQEQLTSTENRIAYARQCYNDFVREYNTALATFPRNLIAGLLGFSPASLFEAEETSRANVQVKV